MNNATLTHLTAAVVFIATSGCAGEARQYEEHYPESKYARAEDRTSNISQYRRISENPAKYLSVTFYPVDDSGRVATTSVVESTFRKEGAMSAALMAYLLAEEGRVDIIRVKVAPVIESKAEIPLNVQFDATLHYEQHIYNSMYQYTPGGGHSESIQTMTRSVNVLLNPGEKIIGNPIDFGELKLLEAGQAWIAYLEIKRKIKSIDAENIIVKPPSGTMSVSSISGLWKLRDARKGLDTVAEMRIEQNEYSIIALGSGWKGQGSFDGLKGYYDWRFSDGRMGRTNIEYDKYSDELHGYVKGSNINWDYIGARASK